MIKKAELPKYNPNTKRLAEIRRTLSLEKSKMGKFFKSHGVKKIGDRTYISIENGESVDIEKLTDIYLTFNKEFRKRNLSNKIELHEIIDDQKYVEAKNINDPLNEKLKDEEDSKVINAKMYQVFNAENLFKKLKNYTHKKKVFNLGSLPSDAANEINLLFDQIEIFNNSHDIRYFNEDDDSFKAERNFLKVSSKINDILYSLEKNYKVKLFITGIQLKQPDWGHVYMGEENDPDFDLKEENIIPDTYEFVISYVDYMIYYFTTGDADSVNLKYEQDYSEKELSKILFTDPRIQTKVKVDKTQNSFRQDRIIMESLTDELNRRTKLQDKEKSNHYYFGNQLYDHQISFSVNYRSFDF